MSVPALARAREHLQEAVDELEEAKGSLPAHDVETLRFCRAEAKVLLRRVKNLRVALGGDLHDAAR